MVTIQAAPASGHRHRDPTEVSTLRRVIWADVALCAISGLALVVAAEPLADLAGLDEVGAIAAAGAFLVVLAAGLAALARAAAATLVRLVPWSAEGDFTWAAASAAVVVLVSMNGTGRALVLAQAVIVAGVGAAKLTAHRAARTAILGPR